MDSHGLTTVLTPTVTFKRMVKVRAGPHLLDGRQTPGEDIMGLFKKHSEPAAARQPEAHRKPKREPRPFNQVPPYEMNEELAERIAMRAYGDADHDGKPDIPARPFPGF